MLKLNASYSKKVPADGEYTSQSYHASIEVELPDGLNLIGIENLPRFFPVKCGFSPFIPQNWDVANQVMMCHRVPRFRVKYEKTTIFQGKMDFRKTLIGDAIFVLNDHLQFSIHAKSKQWLGEMLFSSPSHRIPLKMVTAGCETLLIRNYGRNLEQIPGNE